MASTRTYTGTPGNNNVTATKKWWQLWPNWTMYGMEGNDTLTGGGRSDTIEGGSGNDRLVGGSGNDLIRGEGFKERDNPGDDTIFGGSGNDRIYGDDGSDRLFGGNDNDYILGGSGNDIIDGDSGNDTLSGGSGTDTLRGGSGNDKYYDYTYNGGGDLEDVIFERANSGIDTLVTNATDFVLPENVENLEIVYTSSDSPVLAQGNDLDNHMTGSHSNDFFAGGEGNDTLDGGLGNDTLIGNAGYDHLYGGQGNDRLIGSSEDGVDRLVGYGGGNNEHDTLVGGASTEFFYLGQEGNIFYMDEGFATIQNFSVAEDRLFFAGGINLYETSVVDNAHLEITRSGNRIALIEDVTNIPMNQQVFNV